MAHVVRAWRSSRIIRWVVLFGLLGTLTQVYLSRENTTPQPKAIGSLVSVEKIPEMAGEFCETDGPASKQEIQTAALEERQELRAASLAARAERFAAPAPGAGPDSKDLSKLKPLRWIRDPYAAYSSIAVDPINNEV